MFKDQDRNPVEGPLSVEDGQEAVRVLQEDIAAWGGEDDYFSARLDDGRRIATTMIAWTRFDGAYVYQVNGRPIGVMYLSVKETRVEIDYLVTHPATSGCGQALVEMAVRIADAEGKEGRVTLVAENAAARDAYTAMGFTDDGRLTATLGFGPMALNARTSALWTEGGDGAVLTKYADKRYVTDAP